jgi:hypothetical protein
MKSVIFFGSSNTFGVGLHTFREYYLNEDSIRKLEWPYIQNDEDNLFIKENRWTNKVSKFLNREEINISEVGGSPAAALYKLQITDLDEIDYIFFEFSGIYNYYDRFMHGVEYPKTPHEIEAFLTNGKNDNTGLRKRILEWIDSYNPHEFIDIVLESLKEKIEELKDKKFIILFWHGPKHDNGRSIMNFNSQKYEWLKKYMIKFPTESDPDNYIVHNLIKEKKLTVSDEHPLSHLMHEDIHAGIKGNQIVSEIIINYINEKENTNSWG